MTADKILLVKTKAVKLLHNFDLYYISLGYGT
jgi:hypothetical protein